jgi:Zinc finger C-x8-C-x5-C-x3-H type (and similar)/RNA-binding, Nab2-type zinc finger
MISRKGSLEKRENLDAFLKTRLCRYFPLNKCSLGADCKFAHCIDEIREVPDFRKTRMCELFQKGQCTDSDCAFAHTRSELKVITDVYKTQLCKHWLETQNCKSGNACRFAHGKHELRGKPETPQGTRTPIAGPSVDLQNVLQNIGSTKEDGVSLQLLAELFLLHEQGFAGN